MKKPARRALGSDVLAPHPVDLYAAPASDGRGRSPVRSEARRVQQRRPQLNVLLASWNDVARFKAVAHVRHADLRDVLMAGLALFEASLAPAERRALKAETKRFAAELAQ